MTFDEWWESTGSGIVRLETEDHADHAYRLAKTAWIFAMLETVSEWEKPHRLTDGRRFIDRLRGMAEFGEDDRS